MIIQHNITALNAYRQLGNNNTNVGKNLEKLSSGYKINRAGDDAAGLAISEKMRAQIKGLETAQKNANDGISLIQTAEGALTEVHSMLNRMVELATQASNGTYSAGDRAKLQSEVDSLLSEIDRIAQGTDFNGISLLDGSLSTGFTGGAVGAGGGTGASLVLQVGDTNQSYQQVSVGIKSMATASLGTIGTPGGVAGGLSTLSGIAANAATNITTITGANAAIDVIKAAIEDVSTARSGLGALQNRLEHTINNLGVTTENMNAAESRIRDTDMAKEMMNFTKNNILTQSAQAMLAQANQIPQGVLQLLR